MSLLIATLNACGHRYDRTDLSGRTLGDELVRIGFKGDTPASHAAHPLSAHFEVHIEQGPVLEAEDKPIGVVTGVQGIPLPFLPCKT